MIHELTPSCLAVVLPEEEKPPRIFKCKNGSIIGNIKEWIDLPPGNWQLLGRSAEVSEEQAQLITPAMKDCGYPFEVTPALDMFASLLESKQLTNPWILIRK